MSRYKRVIGDALRSRTNRRQTVEVAVAVRALNRMLEFGRPESVRVAGARTGIGVSVSVPLIRAPRSQPGAGAPGDPPARPPQLRHHGALLQSRPRRRGRE